MIREVTQEGEGAAHGDYGCSSLSLQEWILMMNSHGVEILIAGCVAEMVRDPNPISFFLFFFFFFFFVSCALFYSSSRYKDYV